MQEQTRQQSRNTLGTPIAILLAGIFVSVAVFFGLSGGSQTNVTATTNSGTANTVAPTVAPQAANNQQPSIVTVSIDDDPVLGDANAPVTMIDFSDYECPYCKRHFEESFEQIKSTFVDTGKVKYVYRDLPLPFHEPLATQEAIAANCARDQGGDAMYFEYHDEIFTRTNSNGQGMPKSELYTIADDLGLNASEFKTCLDSEKYDSEVKKDLADAQAAGANGTPTFFVGKTTESGVIQGEILVGAQPFAVIKATIDRYLD